MKYFRIAAFSIASFFAAAPAHAATCAPLKLVHIVETAVTPGIDPASFGAQPRTYYRIGNDKLRIEEAPDNANGIHGLVIVAEPNIWMINLFDATGQHIVDPGPTFNAVASVIAIQGLPGKLAGLQLGCEADFLAANAVAPTRTEHIGDAYFTTYRIADGNDAIELLEHRGTVTPAYARYYHVGELKLVLRYDVYERDLPEDPSLFLAPTGIALHEAEKK